MNTFLAIFQSKITRSNHRRCSIKKVVLKNFANIHKKTPLLQSLFNNVAGLRPCSFIKKRLQHRCFPVNIAKSARTPNLKNICTRLLLHLFSLSFLYRINLSVNKVTSIENNFNSFITEISVI